MQPHKDMKKWGWWRTKDGYWSGNRSML